MFVYHQQNRATSGMFLLAVSPNCNLHATACYIQHHCRLNRRRSVAVSSVIYSVHTHHRICSSDFRFLIGEANSDFVGFVSAKLEERCQELAQDSWFWASEYIYICVSTLFGARCRFMLWMVLAFRSALLYRRKNSQFLATVKNNFYRWIRGHIYAIISRNDAADAKP